jgi:putative membrane protein
MRKISLALVIAVAAWSIQGCTEERGHSYQAKTKVDINGLAFIKTAHEAGLTEIAAAKIAKKNSTNAEVTGFADMMLKDHADLGKDVDSLAIRKFVFIRDTVNYDHKAILDSLAKKTGADFDKAYMKMMVADHTEAEELFKLNTTSNYTEIREVADKGFPMIQKHLEEAKKIAAGLK